MSGFGVDGDRRLPGVQETANHALNLAFEVHSLVTHLDVPYGRTRGYKKVVNEVGHVTALLNEHGHELPDFLG